MLSSNDKSHIKTLYDQYNDMLNYIKTLVDESNSGKLGGDNVHEVKVDLVSGEVSIHN